ncbi:MAG: insulinase family protein, partial [Paramuribaculum sp.]|nr:insulinase family protein [Paramuribaculum sp.]
MKKLLLSALLLTTLATGYAANPFPADPAVRIGRLDNGLTYYIRHNASPEGQADFFIAQRVGSVNEEESQRGLAHFLEHMCFNGTEHFPGNSLISWLESIGVKFGRNLNAYTSTDETVYNICQVPTSRESALDSCLLILSDWSGRLLLLDDDINAERGVIRGEMRQRSTPASRILTSLAPQIY